LKLRKGLVVIASSALLGSLSLVGTAGPAAADPTGTCPDGHTPFPTAVTGDPNKDRNGNGIVCGKLKDGTVQGGPDDRPLTPDDFESVVDDIV
jgi:hypothetical protein